MASFSQLTLAERLARLELKSCRPLPDAKTAISVAIGRFHESWTAYKTITPTLYFIKEGSMGMYVTLGKLRREFELNWEMLEAMIEAVELSYGLEGYLLASEGITQEDPQYLFALEGHYRGEKQYGALELATLSPYTARFVTEFDVSGEVWQDLKLQASSN